MADSANHITYLIMVNYSIGPLFRMICTLIQALHELILLSFWCNKGGSTIIPSIFNRFICNSGSLCQIITSNQLNVALSLLIVHADSEVGSPSVVRWS